jgi:multiple sugar transport system substrate-binding protein
MGYSKDQEAARDFLRWVRSEPVFAEWFASPQGYSDAATRMWEKDKVWDADPVLLPFRDIPRLTRRQMGLRRDRQDM